MAAPDARPEPAAFVPDGVSLIIIGDEILSGKRADKHFGAVQERLQARGLGLSHVEYLGDVPERITASLRRAVAGRDLVFSCGGIGATPDDHTRQCAAAALGVPLALHPQAAELIRERMRDVAREQGQAYEPERPDNLHRLQMGMFPAGAAIIPNPYNKIPGFSCGHVHFVPGFPVMAWPMIEWVLDQRYPHLLRQRSWREQSVIIYGAMEATLTPLMEAIEARHAGLKVFSLPSVDHPVHGRHIELGVKGEDASERVAVAFAEMHQALVGMGLSLGPELVRTSDAPA